MSSIKTLSISLIVGLLISCDSSEIRPEAKEFPFPENLKGEWINHQNSRGVRLEESGVLEFLVLNTNTGTLEGYLSEVDSIIFIDSTRFLLKIHNCEGPFFYPTDTGRYSLNRDTLTLSIGYDFEFNAFQNLLLTRYQGISSEIDTSFMIADVSFNNESFSFESNTYERNLVGYEYYENLDQLIIRAESNNYDCIFPMRDTELTLGIENYTGPGTYDLWEYDLENRNYGMAEFVKWSYDVGDGFFLSGSIEIIEHTDTKLSGKFSANCFLIDEDCSGSVSNGYFEIYN